jgi:hypothetical protein
VSQLEPARIISPAELMASSTIAPQAKASLTQDNQLIEITGDDSKYGNQLTSAPLEIQKDTDYVITLPAKILRGRMSINIKSADVVHAATIVETEEMKTPEEQPERLIQLPFVSRNNERIQVVISNAASKEPGSLLRAGTAKLFSLGPSSNTWTRSLRTLIYFIQKLYITAIMLPLAIFGIILLAHARAIRPLSILLFIPAYYLSIQSATHTEYRYVIIIHYFLFAFAALFIYALGEKLWQRLRKA